MIRTALVDAGIDTSVIGMVNSGFCVFGLPNANVIQSLDTYLFCGVSKWYR